MNDWMAGWILSSGWRYFSPGREEEEVFPKGLVCRYSCIVGQMGMWVECMYP